MSIYTDSQIRCYLERIKFPLSATSALPPPTLETLRRLVASHLQNIPWENLSLHYSTQYIVSVDKDQIFDKFVNKCKGGHCMEHTIAFATVLRSLDYDLYTVSGRLWINDQVGFTHLIHTAIILTIDDTEYLVDVGFGGSGPTAPLPFFRGMLLNAPINGILPEQHRVQMTVFPNAAKKNHEVWALQHRANPDAKWRTFYAFEKDMEFFEADFEM
jgi:arylamine N-acetyltransferase